MTLDVPPPARAPRKGFRIALLLLVALAIEALSYAALVVKLGTGWPLRAVALQRQAVMEGDAMAPPPGARVNALVVHPYLGFVYSPKLGGPAFLAHHGNPVSEQGFLDSSPPIHHRSKGKLILGIFGGSVSYFFSVKGLPALQDELSKDPRFAGSSFEVVRTGLGGYKQPQQLMALNYILAQGGELDVLVNIDGFNEVALYPAENGPLDVFPIYPTTWPQMVQDVPSSRALVGEIAFLREARRSAAKTFSRFPLGLSPTLAVVWRMRDDRIARDIAARTAALQRGAKPRSFLSHGPPYKGTEEQAIQELVAIWKRCSLQMDHLCRANGIRYVHVLQPNQYEGSKIMAGAERTAAYREDHPYRRGAVLGYPLLRKAAQELRQQGVEIYDLTQIFAGVPEQTYLDPCCHLTDFGNEVLAREIARRMRNPAPSPVP